MNRSVLRGVAIILIAAAIIVIMFVLPGPRPERHEREANLDPWVLVSTNPNDKYGTYLGNGFISTRIKGEGVGREGDKALPCFMAGLYNDEKLVPTPTWSDVRLLNGKERFKIDPDEPYTQVLNMKSGTLTTKAVWRAGRKTLEGSIQVIVSRARPNVALVLGLFTSNFDGALAVTAPLGNIDPSFEQHGKKGWWRSSDVMGLARPITVSSLTMKQSKRCLAIAQYVDADSRGKAGTSPARPGPVGLFPVKKDVQLMVYGYASLAMGDGPDQAEKTAIRELAAAVREKLDLVEKSKAAWEDLWQKDIEIDGPRKEQQAIHSCMFYLLQSVREGSDWSIPPMGLSDNAFSGHVFWDADTWIFPALILQHPELAKSIVDYRYKTLPGAIANAKADGCAGAQYAWESGETGREDTPPGLPYRHERHINGDVALAQWQYYLATGDLNWLRARGFPVIKATADYWVSRVTFDKPKNRYEILRVVPPDENADLVDNSIYTNAVAQMNLLIADQAARIVGVAPNPNWRKVAAGMYIPYDAAKKRFIAHDHYRGLDAKQADPELLIYPLQYKIPGQDMTDIYKNTYGFYAPKQIKYGPAMTSSAHSVIAGRLGDSRKAYVEFVKSYKGFLRGPYNYFNEKRSTTYENMCFLTGAAGPIQAAIFGIAGTGMDYFPADPKNPALTYSPCLPPEWNELRITGVQWRGKVYDLIVRPGKPAQLANVRAVR